MADRGHGHHSTDLVAWAAPTHPTRRQADYPTSLCSAPSRRPRRSLRPNRLHTQRWRRCPKREKRSPALPRCNHRDRDHQIVADASTLVGAPSIDQWDTRGVDSPACPVEPAKHLRTWKTRGRTQDRAADDEGVGEFGSKEALSHARPPGFTGRSTRSGTNEMAAGAGARANEEEKEMSFMPRRFRWEGCVVDDARESNCSGNDASLPVMRS